MLLLRGIQAAAWPQVPRSCLLSCSGWPYLGFSSARQKICSQTACNRPHAAMCHVLMALPPHCFFLSQNCGAECLTKGKERDRPMNLVPECSWWVTSVVTGNGGMGLVAFLAPHLTGGSAQWDFPCSFPHSGYCFLTVGLEPTGGERAVGPLAPNMGQMS